MKLQALADLKSIILPCCPECGSEKTQCSGHRTLSDGSDAQRFSCKKCGYRFTDPQALKTQAQNTPIAKYALPNKDAKNLTIQAIVKRAIAGEKTNLDTRLIQYIWKEKLRNIADTTIAHRVFRLEVFDEKRHKLRQPR